MDNDNNEDLRPLHTPAGKFAPGNPGKPKGAVTKVSIKVREAVFNFLEGNIDTIQNDYDSLEPKDRLKFIAELLPYAAPKLQSTQLEINEGLTIHFRDAE